MGDCLKMTSIVSNYFDVKFCHALFLTEPLVTNWTPCYQLNPLLPTEPFVTNWIPCYQLNLFVVLQTSKRHL